MSDALVGGGLSLAGSLIGGSKASKGASRAAELAQFKPYSITSGLGSGAFSGQSGTATLSSPYRSQRDRYLAQSGLFGGQLNQFFAPTREQFRTGTTPGRSRQDIYNDLLSSGRFTTSGGGNVQELITGDTNKLALTPSGRGAFGVSETFDPEGKTFVGVTELGNAYTDSEGNLYIPEGSTRQTLGRLTNSALMPDQDVFSYQAGDSVDYDALNAEADRLFGGEGSGTYDEEAYQRALSEWVSPEQRIYDRLFKMAEGNESLERSSLENRLFAQGMLGSTGGGHRTNALLDAQATKALGREQLAVSLAEDIQNQIQARDLRANQAALGLDQAALDNLRLGASVGTAGASAGANAGRFINDAALGQGGAIANAFAGFANNLDSGIFSQTSTPTFNPTPSPYTFTGSGGNYNWGIK